jgi:hypothetical protein
MDETKEQRRCDVGGNYDGDGRYHEPCPRTPTHRWRTDQIREGHWNYRCTPHVKILLPDLPGLVIEELS